MEEKLFTLDGYLENLSFPFFNKLKLEVGRVDET
jgi:hypothetical protein